MCKKNQYRFIHRAVAVFAALFFVVSASAQEYNDSNPKLVATTQPIAISIVPKDQYATLSFVAEKVANTVSYQWYQSYDGTTKTGVEIEGATTNSYTTEIFTGQEIRYYYCVATADNETVISDVAVVANTGLPVLYINTNDPIENITKDEYVFGDMELVYENGENFSYVFKKEKDGEKKEGIKGRGNTSWGKPKKGYSIKFDSKQSFFNLPESKKWCIIANYTDKTLLRNKFASILGNEIFNSGWNPHFYSVEVVWNGEYQGNYIFCERNVIGGGRIDIQDISDYGGKKYKDQNGDGEINLNDGGFVMEIDSRRDAPYWFITTNAKVSVTLKDPDEVSAEIQNHVRSIVQNAENALYADNFMDEENGWRKYFDENSVIDWFLVNEFAKNNDATFFSSVYMFYNPMDEKIHFGPIWDFDISFGNINYNGCDDPQKWWVKNAKWISRMFADSAFVANVKKRWSEKKNALSEILTSGLQNLADANAISAECNFMKWKILGTYVLPNPAGYENRLTYQSEVDYMKDWLDERIAWMDYALNNTFFVSYNLNGGVLTNANAGVFVSDDTEPFTLNNPTRDGYIFAGWSGTGIESLSKSVEVSEDGTGDRVYSANWLKDISTCDVNLAEGEYIYNGISINPDVVVNDGDYTLEINADYNVVYSNNIVAGVAKVVVSGVENYGGALEKTFTINPKPVILNVASASKSYGEEDPAWNYTVDGLVSVEGVTDELAGVKLARESGEDVGEYTISATIDADANPNYSVTMNKGLFEITPKTTTYAAVKIIEDQNGKRAEIDGEYTGKDTIDVSEAIDVNLIDFKRNVQAGVPSTIVLPFSLPVGASVNAKFYQLQSVGPNGKGGWKAVFNNIGDDNLPQANIPYAFILHEGEEKLQFNLNGSDASVQTAEIQNVDGENGKWYFTGTYAYKVWNENNEDDELGRAYAFAGSNNEGGATKGQFGRITAGAWASPMRAYLCKKDASLTPAMMGRPVAPGESVEARYSVEMLPDMIDVDFVDSSDNGEHTTFAGRLNTRTGEFKMMRNYDLKGRKLNEKTRSRGAYYGKRILKK